MDNTSTDQLQSVARVTTDRDGHMRTFIGLRLDDDTIQAISAVAKRVPLSAAFDPGDYHVTLAFLGDILEPDLEAIERTVFGIPFQLSTLRAHRISIRSTTDLVYACLEIDTHEADQLSQLKANLDRALRTSGIALPPRPFFPHISIGHAAPGDSFLELESSINIIASELAVFTSIRAGGGGPYMKRAGIQNLTRNDDKRT